MREGRDSPIRVVLLPSTVLLWVCPGLRYYSVLLTVTTTYPTPGLLMDIPSVKTGQQLYITLGTTIVTIMNYLHYYWVDVGS